MFSQAVLPNCDRRSGIITDGEFPRNGWSAPGSLEIPAGSPQDLDGCASWGLSTAEEETSLDAMARSGVWGRRDRGAGGSRSHRVSDLRASQGRPASRSL